PLQQLRQGMDRVIDGRLECAHEADMPGREWVHLHDTFNRMVTQLRLAREAHEQSQRVLAERTTTVDRLLDFSQTVQGAGQADQVFTALSQFLERELKLSGIAVLSHQADALPPIEVRAGLPLNVLRADGAVAEMKAGLCPCLRQNLPKHFRPDGSPV